MRPILLALAVAGAAHAAAAQDAPGSVEAVGLLDGWREAGGSRLAGLAIRLGPGWHTYWRAPGSTGNPPVLDWSGSRNLAAAEVLWPAPELFQSFGVTSIGYSGTVVLPVRLTPADPAAPVEVALGLGLGVCNDICTEVDEHATRRIAPDAPEDGRPEIEAALARRPLTAAEAGVARVTCGLRPKGKGVAVSAEVRFSGTPRAWPVAVLEPGQPDVWIGDAMSRAEGRTLTAEATIQSAGGAGPVLERRSLRLTLLDGTRAVDIRGCEAPG